jgi:hypothetical protein
MTKSEQVADKLDLLRRLRRKEDDYNAQPCTGVNDRLRDAVIKAQDIETAALHRIYESMTEAEVVAARAAATEAGDISN